MADTDHTAQKNIGALLRDPFQTFVAQLHAGFAAVGYPDIRPAHGNVFQYIGRDGSRLTELAERAQLTKQSMAYLVDSLAARGYVERIPDPTDGRAVIVRLTERGWEVIRVGHALIARMEADWAAALGPERMQELRCLLSDLQECVAVSRL